MKIVYAAEFVKEFRKVTGDIQELFRRQESIFRTNWRDPRLHTKKLEGHPVTFSFRITRRYRVLFFFVETDMVLFATIGHRRLVYRR